MDVTGGFSDQMAKQLPKAFGVGVMGLMAGIWLVWLIIIVVIYLYFAITLMLIAKKTNTENPWWAWVPILNLFLFFKIARKPLWWIILLFIPLVNIVMMIVTWMEIAKVRGKPDWLGILIIVPVISFFIPAYLALSD